MEYLYLGPIPCEEDAVQISQYYDTSEMVKQVRQFIAMLQERFPNPPDQAFLAIKREGMHDYGTYFEAVIKYNDDDRDATEYAFFVEANLPARWDDKEVLDWRKPVEA